MEFQKCQNRWDGRSFLCHKLLCHKGEQGTVNWKCWLVCIVYCIIWSPGVISVLSSGPCAVTCISSWLFLDINHCLIFQPVIKNASYCKHACDWCQAVVKERVSSFLFGRMHFLLQVASSISLSLIKNCLFYQHHGVYICLLETVAVDI